MSKRLALLTVITLACTVGMVHADGNANFVLGARALDEDDWEPVEDQGVFGVNVDLGRDPWPVWIDLGFHVSAAEEDFRDPFFFGGHVDLTATLAEFSVGVVKTWRVSGGNVRPFAGGGLAAVTAEVEFDGPGFGDVDEDDTSGAIYGRGGVYWRIGSRFNLGVDARILMGSDFDIGGVDFEADYFQIGVLVGWGWPAE